MSGSSCGSKRSAPTRKNYTPEQSRPFAAAPAAVRAPGAPTRFWSAYAPRRPWRPRSKNPHFEYPPEPISSRLALRGGLDPVAEKRAPVLRVVPAPPPGEEPLTFEQIYRRFSRYVAAIVLRLDPR